MSCTQNQKLMYLFRKGELSEWEQKKLQKHLQNCGDCFREFENIQQDWGVIRSLNSNVLHPEPDVVTREIIRKIEHEHKFIRTPKRHFDILDYLPIPQLRFVLTVIVILFVGGLVVQEVFIWNRINNLERRMVFTQSEIHTNSKIHFSKFLDGMVVGQNSHITISRAELENLLHTCSDAVLTNKILLDALRDAVPELDNNFYENGIDHKEMEKLLNNRQKIMSRLREL